MKQYLHLLLILILASCSGQGDRNLEKELEGTWQSQDETRGDEGLEMTSRTLYNFHYEPGTDTNAYPMTQTLTGAMKIKEGRDSMLVGFNSSIDGTYYVKDHQLIIDYDTKTISCSLKCDDQKFNLIKRDLEQTFRITLMEMIKSNNNSNVHFTTLSIDGNALTATDFQGSTVTLTRVDNR